MNNQLTKATAHTIVWALVLSAFAGIVPTAAAHTNLGTGGTFTYDVDFSASALDDFWRTTPIEWGVLDANIEVRHVPGSALGLSTATLAGGYPYVTGDIDDGIALCRPDGTEADSISSGDLDFEDDPDTDNDDWESIDVYNPADGDLFMSPVEVDTQAELPFIDDPQESFSDDSDADTGAATDDVDQDGVLADGTEDDDLDDNNDGKVSRSELQDAADEETIGSLVVPAVRGTFEKVDVDQFGVWYIVSDDATGGYAADPCGGSISAIGTGATLLGQFLVQAATELELTVSPTVIQFAYDDDEDEPEPDDMDLAVTVEWGGDAMENAEVTIFACNRERPAYHFCDDVRAQEGTDVDGVGTDSNDLDSETVDVNNADPAPRVLDDVTDSSGVAEYDEDIAGAGVYLAYATCILQNDDDDYISEPDEVEEAVHECIEPADATAGQVPQIRGNTTFRIAPGELDIELVKGENPVEDRVTEVVWKVTYAGNPNQLVLADNTHGDDDSIYANDNANWTLDITLPSGRHVIVQTGALPTDTDLPGDAAVDGWLECAASGAAAANCDTVTFSLADAASLTYCERFAGDGIDCPTTTGTGATAEIDDIGDVPVITVPEDVDDYATGLDPRVYVTGDDVAGTDAEEDIWGTRLRINPEIDEERPDEAGFNVIDDEDEDDDDLDRRMGYLSMYLPWAAGTYQFELRVNHYSDETPEFVGSWTLDVASAPEFGYDDIEPRTVEVPARVDNSGLMPDAAGWEPDPEEDDVALWDEDPEDEDDPAFAYVLAFTLKDQEGDHVNAYPCNGDERDGDTIEVDDAEGTDDTGDEIVFVPADNEERECPEFDGVDDLRVEGDLLYDMREGWIVETELDVSPNGGDDADIPNSLEACLEISGLDRDQVDLGLDGDNERFDPETGAATDPVEGDEAAVPVYCVFNVVPASPSPIRVIATIDGEEFVQEWEVSPGGFLRVVEVTATIEADGVIRVALTDENGQAVGADVMLFERGDFPAEGGAQVQDEDGDVLTASGSGGTYTFTLSEEDEIDAMELAVHAWWDVDDETRNYAYTRVNLEPASDLETSVSPNEVTAGVPTDFTVNVTDGDDSYQVYFLTHYEYMQVQRQGVAYVEDPDFRDEDFAVTEEDRFDFDFSGATSDEEELTLKAEGPYHVYVRTDDQMHDNNGSMPVVDVEAPRVVFEPGQVAFAISEEVPVTVRVLDRNGDALSGTLRVAYDPDNDFFTSDDYGFAELEGTDVDDGPDEDDEEWGGFADEDDVEDAVTDDYPYSYLSYRDEILGTTPAAEAGAADDLNAPLPTIDVDTDGASLRVTGEEVGPINWTFDSDEGGVFWVNTTGSLEIVAPAISVNPDRLTAGTGTDVTVTVRDLEGEPVENLFLTLCGTPLATATSCTGVVATGADGVAVVSVLPTGTGQLEVWVHEDVTGTEEGNCQITPQDLARINPLTGLALAGQSGNLDSDCDETAGADFGGDEYAFEDTNVIIPVVATQQLLRVTAPEQTSVGQAVQIAVTRGTGTGAQTPVEGATVAVTGPEGTQVFSGTTNAAGQVSFTPSAVGAYTARATAAGFQDGSASFQAVEGDVQPTGQFRVSEFVISPTTVQVGDTVEARATITNAGANTGTATVQLLVGGAQRASQAVTLGAGQSQEVAFDYTPSVAGTATMQLKVGTVTSEEQTLTVQPRDQTGPDGDEDPGEPEPEIPGFGAFAALAALGAAMLAYRRRK